MWGEFFTMTQWEHSSILYLCWIKVSLKKLLLGNYFLSTCFTCPDQPLFILTIFLISWKLKSCKFESIKFQPADWIVFCSVSGCIKRLSLWMYKTMMDASPLHLDCSELTSAQVRRKKASLIYWAGQLKEMTWMTGSPLSFWVIFLHFWLG